MFAKLIYMHIYAYKYYIHTHSRSCFRLRLALCRRGSPGGARNDGPLPRGHGMTTHRLALTAISIIQALPHRRRSNTFHIRTDVWPLLLQRATTTRTIGAHGLAMRLLHRRLPKPRGCPRNKNPLRWLLAPAAMEDENNLRGGLGLDVKKILAVVAHAQANILGTRTLNTAMCHRGRSCRSWSMPICPKQKTVAVAKRLCKRR